MAQIVSVWIARSKSDPSNLSMYSYHPRLDAIYFDTFRAEVELPDADPVVPVIKVEKEAGNAK